MERTASTEYHIFDGAGLSVYAKCKFVNEIQKIRGSREKPKKQGNIKKIP